MGRMFVESMQELDVSLEQMVSMHFSSNMYPPIPQAMVPCAVKAIELCNDGDYNETVELPEGVTYRGRTEVDAATLVEQHRLESFVEWEYED